MRCCVHHRHSGSRLAGRPAKAGIHNHRDAIVEARPSTTFSNNIRRGLWVPASRCAAPGRERTHSRGMVCPSFANSLSLSQKRGRRECRVRAAPAVSCAKVRKNGAHEHTGERRTLRHPLRNGFTAYFVLSPVSGLVVTVTCEKLPASLTPASRRQDHTTSPYAAFRPVRPPEQKRPSHPRPYVS